MIGICDMDAAFVEKLLDMMKIYCINMSIGNHRYSGIVTKLYRRLMRYADSPGYGRYEFITGAVYMMLVVVRVLFCTCEGCFVQVYFIGNLIVIV